MVQKGNNVMSSHENTESQEAKRMNEYRRESTWRLINLQLIYSSILKEGWLGGLVGLKGRSLKTGSQCNTLGTT